MIEIDNEAIKQLSVPERVRLAQYIWDRLRPAADHLPLTKEQEKLLDRRVEERRRDPDSAVARNEVRARLESDWVAGYPVLLRPPLGAWRPRGHTKGYTSIDRIGQVMY